MQRREFNKAAAAAAAVALTGCGGGGGAGDTIAAAPGPAPLPDSVPTGTAPAPAPSAAPGAAPAPGPAPAAGPPPVISAAFLIGTNLASMEAAGSGIRFGGSTLPNVDFTVPRRQDVAWLAANGYTKTRLPIRWELLQPMLHDTVANAAAKAAIGNPGAFHPGYQSYITGVLDAHAAAGIKCVIDCHNYCRYQDYVFQADGSVIGLVKPPNPLIYAFTSDNTQVQTRIFALAPGATLKQSNYMDFFARVAATWKDHPGFGGYGMMNEPFFMPKPGTIVEAFEGFGEDLTIWPTYAKAAIDTIRGIDPVNPIYVGGNDWNSPWTLPTNNPGWPINATNLVYEVHSYLDAFSSGAGYDYDLEVAKAFSSGIGIEAININTGVERLSQGVEWANAHGARLALMETGMPLDDVRWQDSWLRMLNYAAQVGVEVYSWGGGNHWNFRNTAINHVPGWHQNKTLEPPQSGPMKTARGVSLATLFDDGAGWAPAGASVTITVYARGNLASPVTLTVASSNGGALSKSTLVIPAGPNGQDSYTYTPPPNAVVTLTYASSTANVPPPRKVFSLADPVAFAATSLSDAAMALIAKYAACKWELADGYSDYLQGVPAAAGQEVRAISDSGYGSSPGNAMEMINWTNTEGGSAMGTMVPPVMRVTGGRKNSDHSAFDTHGFWCRKTLAVAGLQPKARNVLPYNNADPHFVIAAVSVPGPANTGIVFQASRAVGAFVSELGFANSQPQATWIDPAGESLVLTSPTRLAPNVPAVISLTSTGFAQELRVNAAVAGSGALAVKPADFGFDQFLLGWGFISVFPRAGFGGNIYSAITGRGVPTAAEMQVMERYLGSTAGI